ncbi:leucine-rich repeat receptor-like serine/threonine-protein kinase BAM3 [Capsella rubella]|uniref:leucine-rich repeat receptor-like serine/threonine-protein kinase BAM3 n=1 Tax=Capsella rubella TaxID=81985 RepID=UPI000CD4FCDE|nr:leucine-rich repeat receptor-like serine/threonine-protein kinase BAM3 [Capsella rubella]
MERKLSLGQYLIWLILLLDQLHICKSCVEKERKTLLELKKSLVSRSSESSWDNVLPSWTNDTKSDCCRWEGIDCYPISGLIIGLSIRYSNIDGPFPINGLENLTNLELLNLGGGGYYGKILELKNLINLKLLNLVGNSFSGPIHAVCEMKNLQELNLKRNHFEGELPLCLGSLNKLRVLDLSSNQFSGNLPSSFSSLESLEYLSLSDNSFSGLFSLRPLANLTKLQVFKLSSKSEMIKVETEATWQPQFQLTVLVLGVCSLEKIPSFLVYQKSLRLIDLSNNRLSGNMPTWLLVNNPELEVLQLQNNVFTIFQMPTVVHNLQFLDFSTNSITGLFPDNIGRALPNLVRMNGSNNGFQGNLPSSTGEMVNITFLDLSYNNFSGDLPRNFLMGCLSLKQLKLSHNKFGGLFLPRETSFTSLEELRMDSNLFRGEIGVGLLSSKRTLSTLDMSNNHLVGAIPSWISNLSTLSTLLISNNLLEGTTPTSLLTMPSISLLDLSENQLSGVLPSHVGGDFGIQLFLSGNNFTGPIPHTFLDNVEILDLRDNKLSGSIPEFINTQSIKILLLRGNNLTRSIPRQLCDLSNIRLLDLSDNKLSGVIPSCLYNLSFGPGGDKNTEIGVAYSAVRMFKFYESTFVTEDFYVESFSFEEVEIKFSTKKRYDSYFGAAVEFTGSILDRMYGIDMSRNELNGVIPAELGDLSQLRVMNLSHNLLSSSIPTSFSKLKDIESLDLSHNKLQGSIPQQLTSLTSLAVFDVSYNNLSGIIPQGKQFNTFNEKSYIGNPLLCGPSTDKICEATKSSTEADKGREGKDDEAAIDMVVFYYTAASTCVTALIGVLVVMCFDSPWRRAWLRIVDASVASVKSMLP